MQSMKQLHKQPMLWNVSNLLQVFIDILNLYNTDVHALLWTKFIHLYTIRSKACTHVILIIFNIPWESYFGYSAE